MCLSVFEYSREPICVCICKLVGFLSVKLVKVKMISACGLIRDLCRKHCS